ncbi:TIGR01459 family HAD-type hydrolase [Benzoatithermus flavus]|uniref:TIGR01459 family HAD-type hydrolase n=1 Tax=Benzoatithermus flavus TaxID=3108223 RepID=A0ABU8XNF7_9PROT
MLTPTFVDGIRSFADRYEGFILDQWGVIHDGRRPLPEAVAAIVELKRRNKRLVLLSNSGRRAELNRRRLARMGFDMALFDAVVTSGETAWTLLRHRSRPPFAELGRKCLLFTIGNDLGVVEDLGLELVGAPEEADFLFVTGLEIPPQTLEDYRAVIERAAACRLPMLCSNPDRVAPVAGELVITPGSLAAIYEELGGEVIYVGKPYPLVYGACLDALDGIAPQEIVAIGDSLEHDIKGAENVGIASCFLMGGIHAAGFPPGASRAAQVHHLDELCTRYDARPDWVAQHLVW